MPPRTTWHCSVTAPAAVPAAAGKTLCSLSVPLLRLSRRPPPAGPPCSISRLLESEAEKKSKKIQIQKQQLTLRLLAGPVLRGRTPRSPARRQCYSLRRQLLAPSSSAVASWPSSWACHHCSLSVRHLWPSGAALGRTTFLRPTRGRLGCQTRREKKIHQQVTDAARQNKTTRTAMMGCCTP